MDEKRVAEDWSLLGGGGRYWIRTSDPLLVLVNYASDVYIKLYSPILPNIRHSG